jgi:hypothetical protein
MSLKTTKPFENTFSNKKNSFQFACRERGLIFQVTLGPPRQRKVSFFSAVASWNLLLLDLEEEKVAKKGYKSEKKTCRGDQLKKKRWCLSGKEVPSCDTGPSSAGGGPNTHNKIVFFSSE